MNKLFYSVYLSFRNACCDKKIFFTIILSYFLGLLLPFYCLANLEVFVDIMNTIEIADAPNTYIVDLSGSGRGEIQEYQRALSALGLKRFLITADFRGELQAGETSAKVSVTGSTGDILSFERFGIVKGEFSLKEPDGNPAAAECVVGQGVAKKYELNAGDLITVSGTDYKIAGIIKNYRYYKTVLIPMSGVPLTGESMQWRLYLAYDRPPGAGQVEQQLNLQIKQAYPDRTVNSVRAAGDMARQSMRDGFARSAAILFVGGLSLLLAILNIFVVLSAKYEEDKRNFALKLALGAAKKNIGMEIFGENTMYVLLANLVLWLSSPLLTARTPVRSEFSFSWRTYFILFAVSVSVAAVTSFFLKKRVFRLLPANELRR